MKKSLIVAAVVLMLTTLIAGQSLFANPDMAVPMSGKVIETMNSGGYTYVHIENKGKKTWVAVPQMKVSKGQQVSFQPGSEMINFESKTLHRKFDRIFFSAGPIK